MRLDVNLKSRRLLEKAMEFLFLLCAMASILAVVLICLFLFVNGIPAMKEIGLGSFLLGKDWSPSNVPPSFGIFPMILGSIYVTGGAVLVGVPFAILTAIILSRYCPRY